MQVLLLAALALVAQAEDYPNGVEAELGTSRYSGSEHLESLVESFPLAPQKGDGAKAADQLEDELVADELVVNEYWLLPTTYISICFVGALVMFCVQWTVKQETQADRAAALDRLEKRNLTALIIFFVCFFSPAGLFGRVAGTPLRR